MASISRFRRPGTVGRALRFRIGHVAAALDLRRSGRFAEAAQLAQCTLQLHPEDADAWFELGAAKSALDARGEATSAWLRALDLAPSNDDARLGLANLAWRDGDLPAANRWLSSVSPQRQQDSEALRLKSALDRAGQPAAFWRFDAGVARSRSRADCPTGPKHGFHSPGARTPRALASRSSTPAASIGKISTSSSRRATKRVGDRSRSWAVQPSGLSSGTIRPRRCGTLRQRMVCRRRGRPCRIHGRSGRKARHPRRPGRWRWSSPPGIRCRCARRKRRGQVRIRAWRRLADRPPTCLGRQLVGCAGKLGRHDGGCSLTSSRRDA